MKEDRYYEDTWNGKQVRLDRQYRGRFLTIRECAALFRGREIELHGLRRGHTEYSIACRLEPDPVLENIVNIKSLGTVGTNPDYRLDRETSPFRPHGLAESPVNAINIDGGLLDRETMAAILGPEEAVQAPGAGMYVTGPVGLDSQALAQRQDKARFMASSWKQALGLV